MLGERVEKRRLRADVVDAVEQQDRIAAGAPAAAAQHLELEMPDRDAVRRRHQGTSGSGRGESAPRHPIRAVLVERRQILQLRQYLLRGEGEALLRLGM